jgi:hypothetical protein
MGFPTRRDRLLIQEVGDELVVYDEQRHQAHSLNRTAALVWRHCDGHSSITELAALLESELGIQADEGLVWLALNRLEKAHLLREPLTRPRIGAGISRRQVVRKLGLVGTLTFLVPVVTTLIAPTPAMAQSSQNPCECDAANPKAPPDHDIDFRCLNSTDIGNTTTTKSSGTCVAIGGGKPPCVGRSCELTADWRCQTTSPGDVGWVLVRIFGSKLCG